MLVDIHFKQKPEISTNLKFELLHLNNEHNYKEVLAILAMVCADYYLDPEIGVDDLTELVTQAKSDHKSKMTLEISEEGIDLEFLDWKCHNAPLLEN